LKTEDLNPADKIFLAEEFDKIFGLDLDKVKALELNDVIPSEIIELAKKRKEAKLNKDFRQADEYRNMIKEKGYEIREISLPNIAYSLPVYYVIMPAEVSSNMARFDGVKYGLHADGKNSIEDYFPKS